jgi:hypothetical protein
VQGMQIAQSLRTWALLKPKRRPISAVSAYSPCRKARIHDRARARASMSAWSMCRGTDPPFPEIIISLRARGRTITHARLAGSQSPARARLWPQVNGGRIPLLLERKDGTLVAWYRWFYAPRTGGAYDSHHRTAGIVGRTRQHSGGMSAQRACAAAGDAGDWAQSILLREAARRDARKRSGSCRIEKHSR